MIGNGNLISIDLRRCLPASGGILVLILVNDQDADGERQRSLQRRAGRDEDFRNDDQDDDRDEERLPNQNILALLADKCIYSGNTPIECIFSVGG